MTTKPPVFRTKLKTWRAQPADQQDLLEIRKKHPHLTEAAIIRWGLHLVRKTGGKMKKNGIETPRKPLGGKLEEK